MGRRGIGLLLLIACLMSAAIGAAAGVLFLEHAGKRSTGDLIVRKLVLTDDSHRPRAVMSVDKEGQVSLKLAAPNNRASLSMGVEHRSDLDMKRAYANGEDKQEWVPFLRLLDESGRATAAITTVGHGNALLRLSGAESGSGMDLGFVGDGRDDGSFGAAWGMRAEDQGKVAGIGVLAPPNSPGIGLVPAPPAVVRRK